MPITSHERIQVLHVDDEPAFADLTATFLERKSDRFAVETVTSADEGLEIITDRPPDCVVSDYNMPGMDGLEFLQAVREEYPDLPFILHTGKGSEAVASEAIAADVTDYLQKGAGSERYELLANRVRNAVEARREARRADRQEQLMRLTEFAGSTGGFELHTETEEMLLTDGVRRLIGLPAQADLSLDEAIATYHPEDREDIRQTIDRARQTGEQTHGTWRLQTQDGDERLVDVTFTPATTNGDTNILRGAIHDITEQKERQQELETERRFIQQALDSLEDLFYVSDENGLLQRWNEQVPEVVGYTDAELADMDVIESFPEDEQQRVRDAIETVREGGDVTFETELLTADGQRIPYEFTGARLTDEDGTPTGLVGIGRDLTERRQREHRFRALVEGSNDVISIVDADGRYQYQSPSLERVLGHDPEETVGDTAWEYIHPDDREHVLEQFEMWVTNPDQVGETAEYRARDAEGSWRWMEANGNNQLDNPVLEGYVINSRDITTRKERERELAQTRDLMSNLEQSADAGAWEYDSESDTLMITDGVRRLYGLDADANLTLEGALGAVHPDDRDRFADRLNTCLETGEPYEIDVRLTPPDGGQRWLTARGERVNDGESGDVVRGYIQDITDQKEMERALAKERDLVTGIVETVPVGLSVVDPDGSISFVNEQMESISGRSLQDVEGDPYDDSRYDLVDEHGEPLESDELPFDRVVSRETAIHNQIVGTRRQSGERMWLSVHGAPQYNDDGELERAVFAFEDITEQREREAELSAILGRISDAFFALDEEFRVTHVNGRGKELLEASEDQLLGETLWDVYQETEESDEIWDSLRAAMGTQTTQSRELYYEPRDDWFETTVYPSESGLSVYFRDVTDRKKREQELQELKSQYETLVENFPDGAVYLIDTELECVRAGGEELSEVGLPPDDVEGKKPHALFPEEIADELCHYYEEALDGNAHTFEQEYRGERYRIQTAPVRTDDEGIDHVMAVSQNITERAADKQNLEAQNERLEEFASIVSHDLRNPLSVAEGNLELAQETCESAHLARAADALDRSQALIDDLLTVAREGQTVAGVDPVALADVVESSWETAETERATLETDVSQVIRADESRCRQLFENLYRNAIEHGGDDVTVSVGAMDGGFYVADTGPGIPESDREEVFEAGYSTAEDGTGFGLRIVEQIADAHGWEVTVTESEHGGARFEITGVERAN